MAASKAEVYLNLISRGVADAAKDLSQLAAKAKQAGAGLGTLKAQSVAAHSATTKATAAQVKGMKAVAVEASWQLNDMRLRHDSQMKLIKVGAKEAETMKKLDKFTRKAAMGYLLLKGATLGFVFAGIAGTAESQRLGYAMQLINREIASIFLPIIHKVIEVLHRFAAYLRSLTARQQAFIRRVVVLGTVFLGLLVIVPKLYKGFLLIAAGLKAIQIALVGVQVAAGPLWWILSAIAAVAAAFFLSSENGWSSLMDMLKPVMDIFKAIWGAIKGIWNAIKPVFEALWDALGRIWKALKPIFQLIAKVSAMITKAFAKLMSEAMKPMIRALEIIATKLAEVIEKISAAIEYTQRFSAMRLLGLSSGSDSDDEDEKSKGHQSVGAGSHGFESIDATYRRIAAAGVKTPELREAEKQTEVQVGILDFLRKDPNWIKSKMPVTWGA